MKPYSFVFLSLIIFMGCVSPQKHFTKGNYQKAFNGALKELNGDKNKRKNKVLLNKAFQRMLEEADVQFQNLSTSHSLEQREDALYLYEPVISSYRNGRSYLNAEYDLEIDQIENEVANLEYSLAEEYFLEGQRGMESFDKYYDKYAAQDANRYFNKSREFRFEHESLDSLLDWSFRAGLIHIVIETNAWDFQYNWRIDNQFRNIINQSRGFRVVHYENLLSNADCYVDINFNNLEVIDSESFYNESFTEEIQDGYKTVVDTSGHSSSVPNYITVQGTVKVNTTTRQYNWRVLSTVRKMSNYCSLDTRQFGAQKQETIETYEFSGDSRAIPNRFKNQLPQNFKDNEDRIIESLIADIYRDIQYSYF